MLLDILKELSLKSNVPDGESIITPLNEAINVVLNTPESIRPIDKRNLPGGLLKIPGKKVILIPDLHARREYLYLIVNRFYNDLKNKQCIIVFLGDYLHTEVFSRERWLLAYDEYQQNFKTSTYMDMEMADNLFTLKMLALIKIEFKDSVFYLKGNHDNILNSSENGNRAFRKYALEGDMVYSYLVKNFSDKLIKTIDKWESLYSIMALGNNFIASHSEPREFFNLEEIINYKDNSTLIYDLTWTRNGETDPGVVRMFLTLFLKKTGKYIAGHRHIPGKFKENQENNFVQIHNPRSYPYMTISTEHDIDPELSIHNLDRNIG